MGGGGAFDLVAWVTQDAWALTASPSPQRGETPLQRALAMGLDEVAKMMREDLFSTPSKSLRQPQAGAIG